MGELVQRAAVPRTPADRTRRTGDLPDLRGDPARVVVRRELGHQRDARPAGQQVRLDLREVAAQRGRGPHARDPDRFSPIHFASSRAIRPLDQLDTQAVRLGSVAIIRGDGFPRPRPRRLSARPSQVERGSGVARLLPDDDPDHAAALPSRPRASAPGPGPGIRRCREHCHERSGTSSGDQPLRTSQTPGTTPAANQVRAARKPSAAACSPPPTPRFGPCNPNARLIVPDSRMEGKVRDQVGRGAPDALRHEAPQGDRQVRAPQVPRRGHHAPGLAIVAAAGPSPPSP